MSQLGHKQILRKVRVMSGSNVRFGLKADMTASNLDVHSRKRTFISLSGIGAEHSAPPRGSDFYLFGDGEGIINLNAKVAHGALMGDLNLALWAAFKIKLEKTKKEMSQLRAYTEAVESRLQLARELNAGSAKALSEVRSEVDGLRQLIKAKARPMNNAKRPSEVE